MHPIWLFLLVALVVVWIYLRRVSSRHRLHGRALWRAQVKHLRLKRIAGAETWDERRQRLAQHQAGWRIADRYLRRDAGEAMAEPARAAGEGVAPAAGEGATRLSRARPDPTGAGQAGETSS
jgi:hypothetical protein